MAIILIVICVGFFSILCFDVFPYNVPPVQPQNMVQGNKVLILVPHQDDDVNLVGGILSSLNEQKEVFVAFSTNGDYQTDKEHNLDLKCHRYHEAIEALATCGIPEDHIIFLGYGDKWLPSQQPDTGIKIKHLYNAPEEMIMTSHALMKETYGHSAHPCFRPHHLYTKTSFMQDLEELILYVNADTIFCVDYDSHPDHRALSLFFEKVLGEVMKNNPDYRPIVLKQFAYSTAWKSPRTFYHLNFLSTGLPYSSKIMEEVNCYSWASRLRFPVDRNCITRSLSDSIIYKMLSCYRSQMNNFIERIASRIAKGDKVAWWRPTNNILLDAEVSSDIPLFEKLNDFILVDSDDVTAPKKPFNHGWFVKEGKQNEATFRFAHPSSVHEIWLYDHPAEDNQVQELTIELSNGKILTVHQLPANGEPLRVKTGTKDVLDGFTLRVNRFWGKNAGLTEVEAYEQEPCYPCSIIKLMDAQENFMYDYITARDGILDFSIYSSQPCAVEHMDVQVVDSSSADITLTKKDHNAFRLYVPSGESCKLEVKNKETHVVVDAARIQNVGIFTRFTLGWYNLAAYRYARTKASLSGLIRGLFQIR